MVDLSLNQNKEKLKWFGAGNQHLGLEFTLNKTLL
jgi:hypothetical protein